MSSPYTFERLMGDTSKYDLKLMQQEGLAWYRDQLKQLKKNKMYKYMHKSDFIAGGRKNTVRRLEIGKMYMYEYVPKYRDTLPVYDRYPLVLPFNTIPNGFIGINLHYLPHKIRAWLLDRLMPTASPTTNKLRLDWGTLRGLSRANVGKYATHKYLLNHVTSQFRMVEIQDYSKAIMLPMASWYGNDRFMVNYFKRLI